MIKILQSILNAITTVFEFIGHTISSLINLLSKIPSFFSFLIRSIGILPSIFIPFIVLSIIVSIIYFILGRNHD